MEIQHVGDAVGNGVKTGPPSIVAVHDADKDPHLAEGWGCRTSTQAQARGRITGVLDAGVGLLQEEPLLGIHQRGFLRGDVEEEGVELVDVAEETAPFAVALARLPFCRVKKVAPVPAVARYFAHAMASGL